MESTKKMTYHCKVMGKELDEKFPNTRQYGARYAVIILFVMNLINFSDRYIPSAIKPLYKKDLKLNDLESALPITATLLVYLMFAPIYGYLSDYKVVDRRILLFTGVFLWSIATSLAALSQNINQLVCIRAILGIGEAAFATIGTFHVLLLINFFYI